MNDSADHSTHNWKYWADLRNARGRKRHGVANRHWKLPRVEKSRCKVCYDWVPWYLVCDRGVCHRHKHTHSGCRTHYWVGQIGPAVCLTCCRLLRREDGGLRCSGPRAITRAALADWFSPSTVEPPICTSVLIDINEGLIGHIQIMRARRGSPLPTDPVIYANRVIMGSVRDSGGVGF